MGGLRIRINLLPLVLPGQLGRVATRFAGNTVFPTGGGFVAPSFQPARVCDTQPSLPPVMTPPPSPELPIISPHHKDLSQVEDTFRALFALCPTDELGIVDTSSLRNGNQLTVKIKFTDGTEKTTEQLLRMHENVWTADREARGRKKAPLNGTLKSEARLLDVFRRVSGRHDLMSARDNVTQKTVLPLDVPQVRLHRSGEQLKVVLQKMWTELIVRGEQFIPRTVRLFMVQAKNGEREQVHTLMVIYWKALQREFGARGITLPDFGKHVSDAALDIMHYQLLGRVRPQQKMAGNVVAVPLSFDTNDPLPDTTTLRGTMSVLYRFSQTPLMIGFDRFPFSPKGNSVILFDPRTGLTLNYATVLDHAHYLLAKTSEDPLMSPVLRSIPIDKACINNPDVARTRTPGEDTRISLLAFVQRHKGLPEVAATTVTRRRGSDTQPVIQVGPPQVPRPRSAALQVTQPYLAVADISHDVAVARFINRMTFAESLSDARVICASMASNGLSEAMRVGAWLESVTRGEKDSLEAALAELPMAEQLKPIVLPLVLNDVALRAIGLTTASSRSRVRFEAMMNSGDMMLADSLHRYDYIVRFVVEEEARLDARPRRSPSSQWRIAQLGSSTDSLADTQTDLRLRIPPWSGLEVPAVFANAMKPMLSAPDIQLRVTDISRVFMSFMPLDEMPLVQKGRGLTNSTTNDFVYNALTGRSGSMFDMPPMTKADLALRAQLSAIGDARQMLPYNEYWLGRGIKIARRDGIIPPTLRFYMAINPARAAEVLTALNDLYDKWNPKGEKDVQFKMTNVPPELVRTDSALFFTDAANQGIWEDIVALRNAHPDYFRPVVGPLGTANFRDGNGQPMGISVAEAPNRVTESRNSVLGNLNTQGMRDYRTFIAQGMSFKPEELLRATAYYLQKGGIDLERPAFYSGTAQRAPGWITFAEVYRQTDQYRGSGDSKPSDNSSAMCESWAGDPWTPDPTRAIASSKSEPGLIHRMSDGPRRSLFPQKAPQDRRPEELRQERPLPKRPRNRMAIPKNWQRLAKKQSPLRRVDIRDDYMRLPSEILEAVQHRGIPEGEGKDSIPVAILQNVDGAQLWRANRNILFMRDKASGREGVTAYFGEGDIPGYPQFVLHVPVESLRELVTERSQLVLDQKIAGKEYPVSFTPIFYKRSNGREGVFFTVSAPGDLDSGVNFPWNSQWMTASIMDTLMVGIK